MDWVDRPKNYKGLYGILQLLQGSHLDNFPQKTLKLSRVAFHSLTFQFLCLDFQSNQYKKLAPVLSVKMAGYWPCSFFGSLWTLTPSQSITKQKNNLANISHLDLMLGQ